MLAKTINKLEEKFLDLISPHELKAFKSSKEYFYKGTNFLQASLLQLLERYIEKNMAENDFSPRSRHLFINTKISKKINENLIEFNSRPAS